MRVNKRFQRFSIVGKLLKAGYLHVLLGALKMSLLDWTCRSMTLNLPMTSKLFCVMTHMKSDQ